MKRERWGSELVEEEKCGERRTVRGDTLLLLLLLVLTNKKCTPVRYCLNNSLFKSLQTERQQDV